MAEDDGCDDRVRDLVGRRDRTEELQCGPRADMMRERQMHVGAGLYQRVRYW